MQKFRLNLSNKDFSQREKTESVKKKFADQLPFIEQQDLQQKCTVGANNSGSLVRCVAMAPPQ